ncbi:FAD-binding oxidoreductase [Magnetovibrio sp. PR-2]|uniref:FAD-binding oxidoreductase n=1 Tax=Magnetovibrio sp. PR-2 TaxID=3120356 RepID=UPI002FCE2091
MSASGLITDLIALLGETSVITDAADLAGHLTEQRGLYTGTSPALTKPRSTQDISDIVRICAKHNVPVVVHGGNTGLVGGGIPDGAVLIDMSRLNAILDVDPVNLTMTVEAGAILANVQDAAADADTYFPLSLAAEGSCQIGGNLSTNAGGVHVVRYGNARQLVLGLEVVLADGRVWDGLRSLRKNNTGYELKELFLGSEGTLGIITKAVLRLYPKLQQKAVALAGCASFDKAQTLLHLAQKRAGDVLMACEALNGFSMELVERHIDGASNPLEKEHYCYVLLELGSTNADAELTQVMEALLSDAFEAATIEDAVIAQSEAQADGLWKIRESIPEAQKYEGGSIKHDVSVPVSRTAEMIAKATDLVSSLIPGVRPVTFGHLGDGNIHFNLTQPEDADKQAFLGLWHATNAKVHDLIAEMNGSFSAEHGIGQLKTDEMARLKSDVELDLMRTLKQALDPHNHLNPGKVLPPKS